MTDEIVHSAPTRDMRKPELRHGCIRAEQLLSLSSALTRIEFMHSRMRGIERDRPCLRRIELDGEHVIAHVSMGPDVGGVWMALVLTKFDTWEIRDESHGIVND